MHMQKVILEDGRSDTQLPLAILVNHNSASASEILAGALRDNHRAVVLGDQTFGKGKIQSVFELGDGSALFVTVARCIFLLTARGVGVRLAMTNLLSLFWAHFLQAS